MATTTSSSISGHLRRDSQFRSSRLNKHVNQVSSNSNNILVKNQSINDEDVSHIPPLNNRDILDYSRHGSLDSMKGVSR